MNAVTNSVRRKLALLAVAAGVCGAHRVMAEGTPDLSTPAVQAVRQEWMAAREKIDAERRTALDALLAKHVAAAREQVARARVSGNQTQLAVGNATLKVFEDAAAALKKDGTFALPEQARREVQPLVDTVKRSAAGPETVRTASRTALDGETAAKLRAALATQGTPVESDAAAAALLPRLETASAATPPPAATNTAPAVAEGTPPPKDPEEIASNGTATDWEALLTVSVRVASLEIVSVPVLGVEAEREYRETGEGSQSEYVVRLTPSQTLLPSNGAVLFRAMSVPGKAPVSVLSLPSARNGWKLEIRCRPQPGGTPHAVRLEVSRASAQLRGGSGAAAAADAGPTVKVRVVTRPEGASVWVNGRPAMGNRDPLSTPCDVALPAAGADIVLRKRGHLDGRVGRYVPKEGQPLQAVLTADPDFVDRTVRVTAMTPGGHTGVTLKPGQRVSLTVEGLWSCGERGEMVGPEGYPIEKYGQYYVNPAVTPRVLVDEPYGALLVRVGTVGPWRVVGREMTLKSEAGGPLVFDINESAERNMRRDNKGGLDVKVQTQP